MAIAAVIATCGCASMDQPKTVLLEGRLSNFSEITERNVDVDFAIIILSKEARVPHLGNDGLLPSGTVIATPLPEELHVRWRSDYQGKQAKIVCEFLPGQYMREITASCYVRKIVTET